MNKTFRAISKLLPAVVLGVAIQISLAHDPKAAQQTFAGHVVDLACYAGHNSIGDSHRECATKCAKAGVPWAILDQKTATHSRRAGNSGGKSRIVVAPGAPRYAAEGPATAVSAGVGIQGLTAIPEDTGSRVEASEKRIQAGRTARELARELRSFEDQFSGGCKLY